MFVKAGSHSCEFGRILFNDEDSPVIGDRTTDLGSWISFSFHFDSIKEGCPSTGVVLQGALHLKTLITIYNYQMKKRKYNTKP